MRILIFNQYFCTPKGSYGTRVYEFAKRWVAQGDLVTVVTSVYDRSDLRSNSFTSRHRIDDIDVRAINVPLSNRDGFMRRMVTYLAYAFVSCYYAVTVPTDLVVASSGPITAAIPALLARYVRRKPFIFEVRDLWPEGAIQLGLLRSTVLIFLLRAFERLCYRSAVRVVVLSEGMAAWIRERYGSTHVEVVTNASDNMLVRLLPPLRDLPAWAVGKKLAVYAGGVGLIHNCGQLLRVAEELRSHGADDVSLVVIGDGNDRVALEERARAHKLTNIHFLGRASKEEVFAWLQVACCALSVVNQNEFFDMASPNKIFDALAAGVPIVQDTQGWMKAVIERRQCGFTVPRNDSVAMAEAVALLAGDSTLRDKMSANARRTALDEFDRDTLSARMRAILHESFDGDVALSSSGKR